MESSCQSIKDANPSTISQPTEPKPNSETPITKDNKEVDYANTKELSIIEEFQYLLEKSQELFSGLKDLSLIGGRNWEPYFAKTFDIYSKLWKFQQLNRQILENKTYYGLKRWEIGEIASRIGQLYYHYYLRTSDTNYLNEAFVFYEAIRERHYFKDVLETKNENLIIKKLRFVTRFIVVCLIMKKPKMETLLRELIDLADQYINQFKPQDSLEWQIVLQEIISFIQVENKLLPKIKTTTETENGTNLSSFVAIPIKTRFKSIKRSNILESFLRFDYSIQQQTIEENKSSTQEEAAVPKILLSEYLKLKQIIIVGNVGSQTKFNELSIDMYRMLQFFEREIESKRPKPITKKSPISDKFPHDYENLLDIKAFYSASTTADNDDILSNTMPRNTQLNPQKYLLYKPSFAHVYAYLSFAFKNINYNSILLLYLSSDSVQLKDVCTNKLLNHGFVGGCKTNTKKQTDVDETSPYQNPEVLASNCLNPADLLPFTRRPLVLIVDSCESKVYGEIPDLFDQPFIALMSPRKKIEENPGSLDKINNSQLNGNLFTMFLYSPILAIICLTNSAEQIETESIVTSIENILEQLETNIMENLIQNDKISRKIKRFLVDEFVAKLIVRFVICCCVLRKFKNTSLDEIPSSSPKLPVQIYNDKEVVNKIKTAVQLIEKSDLFDFSKEIHEY